MGRQYSGARRVRPCPRDRVTCPGHRTFARVEPGVRVPAAHACLASPSRTARSATSSCTFTAVRLFSMLATLLAPGIGSTWAPTASSHASAIACGDVPCFAAMRASVCVGREPAVAPVTADWRVGHVGDAELAAACDETAVDVSPLEQVAAILHGCDLRQLEGLIEMPRRDVRQADCRDRAFVTQLHELAERIRERHIRVDGVQVVQRDRRAQVACALLAAAAEPRRRAVDVPPAARPREPAFGCDDHVAATELFQRRGNQPLVVTEIGVVEAVADRGIDEVAAAREERLDHHVPRALAGPALDRQGHAAEPDRLHAEAGIPEGTHAAECSSGARRRRTICACRHRSDVS